VIVIRYLLYGLAVVATGYRVSSLWHSPNTEHVSLNITWPKFVAKQTVGIDHDRPGIIEVDGVPFRFFGSKSSLNVSISVWDPAAIVYVSAGTDGASGVVDVDDDGNAVVDDVSELGATGSDDRVLTPEDSGYQDAQSGKILAMVLSHGAMKRVEGDAVISGPGQVRIDLVDNDNRLTSRIIDLQ